jgi:prepilin-type N-terminal cleavage/methylation domain-containing protein
MMTCLRRNERYLWCGKRRATCCGFTVIELLVVASILAMLFGMIAVGMKSNSSGEVKRAAQQIASTILSTQSRGLGTTTGSAVMLAPLVDPPVSPATAPSRRRAVSLHGAEVPAHVEVRVVSGFPAPPGASQVVLALESLTREPAPDLQDRLQTGFRVQFFGLDPTTPASCWFAFALRTPTPPPPPGPTPPPQTPTTTATVPGLAALNAMDGQSAANTIWPIQPDGGGLLARIARAPIKGDAVLNLRRSVAIDLRYSGTGDDPESDWGNLADKGVVAIVFDPVGSLDVLACQREGESIIARRPIEPVYLLVAAQADVEKDSSLAEARSQWVVIQPQTGRVTVSPNVPQTDKDRNSLRAARQRARATLQTGA